MVDIPYKPTKPNHMYLICVYIYLPTPPVGQDMTQDHFLSRV